MSEFTKETTNVGSSKTHKVSCFITNDAQSSIKSTYHTTKVKMLSTS